MTGSTQAAATEMAYIKDTANQMGLAVNDVVQIGNVQLRVVV